MLRNKDFGLKSLLRLKTVNPRTLIVRFEHSPSPPLALFTATGIGFIPFRVMDTYREYGALVHRSDLFKASRDV